MINIHILNIIEVYVPTVTCGPWQNEIVDTSGWDESAEEVQASDQEADPV